MVWELGGFGGSQSLERGSEGGGSEFSFSPCLLVTAGEGLGVGGLLLLVRAVCG